jgi:diguanylate cyclase
VQKSVREQAVAKAAIALMDNHGVAPSPTNFELFFAYASGGNPPLLRAVDAHLKAKKPFTPDVLEELRHHVSKESKAADQLDTLSKDVSAALGSVLVTLETAGKDAASYGRALSGAISEMVGDPSPAAVRKLMDGLLGATQAMEARTKMLEDELHRSSAEVTELKTKLDDVRKESLTDPLTAIPNRKLFDIALANAIHDANETGEEFVLCMCDIDHFKTFNDTWGHQTGDQVLRLVGACLSENVKGRDTAARYGGEEFAVILRQTRLEHALNLANQIRGHVESKKLVKKSTGDILGTITISIGVAQFVPGETTAGLIGRADDCLYAAKRAGRNCVIGDEEHKTGAAAA